MKKTVSLLCACLQMLSAFPINALAADSYDVSVK